MGLYAWEAASCIPPGCTAEKLPIYALGLTTGREVAESFGFNLSDENSSYGHDQQGRLDVATIRGRRRPTPTTLQAGR